MDAQITESGSAIDFYRVSLDCEAAPAIGCGCRAKPVLNALADALPIAGAWLSRAGTTLALLWRDRARPSDEQAVEVVLANAGLTVRKITNHTEREPLLEAFHSGTGWYSAGMLDRLSEEEAETIAERLVRRTAARVRLDTAQADALKRAIADACAHVLTRDPPNTPQARATRIAQAVLETVRSCATKREMSALEEAVAQGHRPLPDEQ